MINKNSNIVQVFTADYLGREVPKDLSKDEAMKVISELASNYYNPVARAEIAQIVGYTVNNVLGERLNFLENMADVKRIGHGEKAQFRVKVDGITAFIQAKGATTESSKIAHKFVSLDTLEVSARPKINFQKLASGQQEMGEVIDDAVEAMEKEMVQYIETVCYNAFSALASPNYASGAGIVTADLDPLVVAMSRYGRPAMFGDLQIIAKLTAQTGFNNAVADAIAIEHNQNGYVGNYKGAIVNKLNNYFTDNALTTTALRGDLIYIVPAGSKETRPLKVAIEGDVFTMDGTQIDDRSWEILLAQNFGTGIIGDKKLMAVYEDTTL